MTWLARSHFNGTGLKPMQDLWEITQPFGLRCRAENKARERVAYPVGAASAAKQAPRWMAPASPVFAAEAAPTGPPLNQ